jgi:hypothetical protein
MPPVAPHSPRADHPGPAAGRAHLWYVLRNINLPPSAVAGKKRGSGGRVLVLTVYGGFPAHDGCYLGSGRKRVRISNYRGVDG